MKKIALHWQVLIALVLALVVGILVRHFEAQGVRVAIFGVTAIGAFDFLGTLFLNALKMLIVPLVASSIISGVAGIGQVVRISYGGARQSRAGSIRRTA